MITSTPSASGSGRAVPRRGRIAALAAGLAVVAASVLFSALPAAAHDELLGTDPADGSTVDALPKVVTLTFSATVLESSTGDQIQVTDASGASLSDGAPKIVDNVVTQPLSGSATGAISVLWRVVSQDGHPVSGEFGFTVTGPALSPSPTPTSSVAPVPTATSAVSTPAPSTSSAVSSTGASPAPWIILGAVTIAAMAGVGYLIASRARRDRALAEDDAAAHPDSPNSPRDTGGRPPGGGFPPNSGDDVDR